MTHSPENTASSETKAPAAAVVPDRAALEGLEAKWSAQWKADDT
ncbi:MAG: valine--tRNA ligase, partial [Marmoricola sp.]|nr:valine--tRNA ligase [Marmoricola sp.]